ncbi:hypothetical protein ACFWRZ_08990 [Streptomyces rubiginosohelvolus]|uniref:hypothetical protein n=1 Tax=Streptomyces rubiginosohelvolus TaxID=67362 RepID=UPI00364FE60D
MNLYPNESIDVGVTRTPTPARYAPGGITSTRLDPVFLTDEERVLPLVADWTREELHSAAVLFSREAARRDDAELLALLREWNATWDGPDPDAVKAEFVTDPNGDSVRWSENAYYVHHADGSVHEFEFPEEGEDDGFAVQDERFRELLATRSDDDRPVHGAHLFVDLRTGVFTVEGPHAL